jgi:hypothetical protein
MSSFFSGQKRRTIFSSWLHAEIINDRKVWGFVFLDKKKNIEIVTGELNDEYVAKSANEESFRLQLQPLVELLSWIQSENKTDNRRVLIVNTKDVFTVNCISEWIDRWKKADFQISGGVRPNSDLLSQISDLKVGLTVKMKLIKNDCEYSRMIVEEVRTNI